MVFDLIFAAIEITEPFKIAVGPLIIAPACTTTSSPINMGPDPASRIAALIEVFLPT